MGTCTERGMASGWPLSLQVYRIFCDTVRASGMGTAIDPGLNDFRPKKTKDERVAQAASGVVDLHSQSGGDKFLTVAMVRDKFHEWEMPIDMHQAAELYCHYDVDGDGLVTPGDLVSYFAGGLEENQLSTSERVYNGCKDTARFNPLTPQRYDEDGIRMLWHKYARLNQRRRWLSRWICMCFVSFCRIMVGKFSRESVGVFFEESLLCFIEVSRFENDTNCGCARSTNNY